MKIRTKLAIFVLPLLLAAALAAVLWYAHSERFRELLRSAVIAKLEQASGLSCEIGRFRVDLVRGAFSLEDLLLQQPTGDAAPFRFALKQASGSIDMAALLGLEIRLAELTLVRPQLVLVMGKGESRWNPESFLKAFRQSLQLSAGSVTVREGWLETTGGRIPLDFSVRDFLCEVDLLERQQGYRIHLVYRNGRVQWAQYGLAYDLEARADVTLEGVDVAALELRYGKSLLRGKGTMSDWESPRVLFHVDGTAAAADLSMLESHFREAEGDFSLQGDLGWGAGGLEAAGTFSSASGFYRGVAVKDLKGNLEYKDRVLSLRGVGCRLGASRLQMAGDFPLDDKDRRMSVSVSDADLRDGSRMFALPALEFDNRVDADVLLVWRRGWEDLQVSGSLELRGPPTPRAGEGRSSGVISPAQGIPAAPGGKRAGRGRTTALRGNAEFRYAGGIWHFPSAQLESPDTRIGAVSSGPSSFRLHLITGRPAELLEILGGFSSTLDSAVAQHPDLMTISGRYQLDGDVRVGSLADLSFQGTLGLADARWGSYEIDGLSAFVHWKGREIELRSLEIRKGKGTLAGTVQLVYPRDEEIAPSFSFQGSAGHVSLDSLREFGVDYGAEAAGILSGSGNVSYAQGNWRGRGKFSVGEGKFAGERFDSLQAAVELQGSLLRIDDCRISREGATLMLQGEVELQARTMGLAVRLTGFSLGSLPLLQEKNLDVGGRIGASGRLGGSFANPQFAGKMQLDSLRYASWDIGSGSASVELKDRLLNVDAAVESRIGSLGIRASVSNEPGYRGSARVELRDWNIQEITAGRIAPFLSDLSTALQGKIELEGAFSDPLALNARGEIDGARLKIHDYVLSNDGKIRFTASDRLLQLQDATVVGEGTRLALKGAIPLDDTPKTDLRLSGDLSLVLLERLEKKLKVKGSTLLDVRAEGALQNPLVVGRATISGARLDYGELPFHISGLRGEIVFSRNTVHFEDLQGTIASGPMVLTGAIEHDNARLRAINLQLSAKGARIPYPKDFRSIVDMDLALTGGPESQVVSGEVRVVRSEYLRDFNLLEQIASRSTAAPGPLTTDPFLLGLRLNVTLSSDEGLYVDNEITKLRGSMRLSLRGTPAYPVLIGRVEANEGSLYFRGNRFEILRAAADFLDRNRINPLVEVRAEADVRSYRLLLDVNGDLDHLQFNITSDPPLSTVDVLTLLTTGKSQDLQSDSSRRQAEITGLSAASILSESLTGVLGKRVERLFGLESFRVDPFLAGAENDPTARVTISERLSKDLSITFSRNLSTNEEQIVLVEYNVNRNLSIIATRDENGQFALDFRFRKRF